MLATAILLAALSAIPFRGVVEGYYGRPWGTEGRISLMKFMGQTGLNTFIYGPKDDPYHHARWREPYPAEQMADFAKLLKVAKANRIVFFWAIHLGGGFNARSEADYQTLFNKLELMYQVGVRGFAVFFDDFGSSDANAHAEICNRVQREFLDRKGNCAPLVMCPNVYWGTGHPYQRTLGEKLDRKVNIMWTGRGICSDIRADDVAAITRDFRRAPFVWWNWPVNDYCRRKVLLGRTYGIDSAKYAGFVLNPMENGEASKIALYGFAAWCRDPASFDSRKVWEEGFARIYRDPEVARAMRIFAEHNSDQGETVHGYRREESVSVAPLCAKVRAELAGGTGGPKGAAPSGRVSEATLRETEQLFKEVGHACEVLAERLPREEPRLWMELEGWVDNERCLMGEGMMAVRLLRAKKGRKAILRQLQAIRRKLDHDAEAHTAKFAEATFSGDKGNVKRPEASTRELKPLIDLMLETELRALYGKRFRKPPESSQGLRALSGCRSMPSLVASRSGRFAGLERVMEPKTVRPDEWFGLAVPENWQTDYFHAILGDAAVQNGVIEVSRDGASWQRLETRNRGGVMETELKVADGWRQARYRNTSRNSVTVKIELFKFDVRGAGSVVDDMLREFCR